MKQKVMLVLRILCVSVPSGLTDVGKLRQMCVRQPKSTQRRIVRGCYILLQEERGGKMVIKIFSKTEVLEMSLSSFGFQLMNSVSEVREQNMSTFTNTVTLKLQNTGEHAKTLWHFFGAKIFRWWKRNELVKTRLAIKMSVSCEIF